MTNEWKSQPHQWVLYLYPKGSSDMVAARYTCDPDDNSPPDHFCKICDEFSDIDQKEIERRLNEYEALCLENARLQTALRLAENECEAGAKLITFVESMDVPETVNDPAYQRVSKKYRSARNKNK